MRFGIPLFFGTPLRHPAFFAPRSGIPLRRGVLLLEPLQMGLFILLTPLRRACALVCESGVRQYVMTSDL